MKRLLILLIVIAAIGCKKTSSSATYCYECQITNGSTSYSDVGCMTEDDFNKRSLSDNLGNGIDKSKNCRKK